VIKESEAESDNKFPIVNFQLNNYFLIDIQYWKMNFKWNQLFIKVVFLFQIYFIMSTQSGEDILCDLCVLCGEFFFDFVLF